MMIDHLSPEARKARTASELKRRSFWPKLALVDGKLVLTHPHRGGYKARRDLAAYIAKELSQLRWNSKECRWEGPPELLPKILASFSQAGEVQLHLDNTLEQEKPALPNRVTLTVQYPSSRRYLRDRGKIVEVQQDDGESRPPRNGFTDPDTAGRYLESRGYEFLETESRWLDRPNAGFRRRRRQVFRLAVA